MRVTRSISWEDQQRERRRLSLLRMQLVRAHPFWGYLLLHMRLLQAPELDAFAATDGVRRIWYNPGLTRYLSARQLGFVLAHEAGHVVFASRERLGGRRPGLWNTATDYAINRVVAAIGDPQSGRALYDPPDGDFGGDVGEVRILLDPCWAGMTAEQIYAALLQKTTLAGGGGEVVQVNLPLKARAPDAWWDYAPQFVDLLNPGGGIDLHWSDDLTAADVEVVSDRVSAALAEAVKAPRPGNLPGELIRGLEQRRPSRVPWQHVLRSYLSPVLSREEYVLARPNRRYLLEDVVVPGLHADREGSVVIALDTSGSIDRHGLTVFAAEVAALGAAVHEITLLVGDTDVRQVVRGPEVVRWLREGRLTGGGGTDHRPFFAWVEESRTCPDAFIGLTDLYSRFPERPPSYPVLWVVPESHGPAPWGRTLVA